MNQIITGRPGVAFEVHESGPWFMAGWHGAEHLVAATGWPEMWARSGNLIGVLHRPGSRSFGYAVFSPTGTRLATLIDTAGSHRTIRLPSTLPGSNGRMDRVQAISWR